MLFSLVFIASQRLLIGTNAIEYQQNMDNVVLEHTVWEAVILFSRIHSNLALQLLSADHRTTSSLLWMVSHPILNTLEILRSRIGYPVGSRRRSQIVLATRFF